MNANDEYRRLMIENDQLHERSRQIMKAGQAHFTMLATALWKERNPKVRKVPESFGQFSFSETDIAMLRAQCKAEYLDPVEAIRLQICTNRERMTLELIPLFEFKPQPYYTLVKISSSHTFGSQGFGAMTYARGAARVHETKLLQLGYKTVIRDVNHHYVKGTPSNGNFGMYVGDYWLWADCTEEVAYALDHIITADDVVATAKRVGLNEFVLLQG